MTDEANLLVDCAGILDTVAHEWKAQGAWSDWDQSVRDRITARLQIITPLRATHAPLQAQTSVPAGYRVVPVKPDSFTWTDELYVVMNAVQAQKSHPRFDQLLAMWFALCAAASPAPASAQVTEEPTAETDFGTAYQAAVRTYKKLTSGTHSYSVEYLVMAVLQDALRAAALHPGREEAK